MPAPSISDKKGHICPPSNAMHPADRWESLFVYAFIVKYTNLRNKVDGLSTPMDFEDAVIAREPTPVMTAILTRFVTNLRPHTRHINSEQISTVLAGIFTEYFKSTERTVFWDETRRKNINPFDDMNEGFFAAEWDLKLKVLRQLVELQLSHSTEVKNIIDRAWGLTQIKEKRKGAANTSDLPSADDPQGRNGLALLPLGQDNARTRYWVIDDSPRVYTSTNPWKITASFQSVSTTRDEYIALIKRLKTAIPTTKGGKRPKGEQSHVALITALEERIEKIDAELAKIARARKKREQREILLAQAELRSTRTRRQTKRPDYVYNDAPESDGDEGDAYQDQPVDEDDDFEMEEDDADSGNARRASTRNGELRRSGRAIANNMRQRDNEWSEWRGERRSSRLGAPSEVADLDEPPTKRARTVDSTTSDGASTGTVEKDNRKTELKANEFAVEQIPGKKRSKYWFYAVEEPLLPVPPTEDASMTDNEPPPPSERSSGTNGTDLDETQENSLSSESNEDS